MCLKAATFLPQPASQPARWVVTVNTTVLTLIITWTQILRRRHEWKRRRNESVPTDDRCQCDAGKPQTASSAPPLLWQSPGPVHLGCSPWSTLSLLGHWALHPLNKKHTNTALKHHANKIRLLFKSKSTFHLSRFVASAAKPTPLPWYMLS